MCAHIQSIPGPLSAPPSLCPGQGLLTNLQTENINCEGQSPHSRPVSWGTCKDSEM